VSLLNLWFNNNRPLDSLIGAGIRWVILLTLSCAFIVFCFRYVFPVLVFTWWPNFEGERTSEAHRIQLKWCQIRCLRTMNRHSVVSYTIIEDRYILPGISIPLFVSSIDGSDGYISLKQADSDRIAAVRTRPNYQKEEIILDLL